MRKLFDSLTDRLRAFIEQRDDLTLVVCCPETEAAYVLKSLEAIEQADGCDIHWMFAEPFADPKSYVAAIVTSFEAVHTVVCQQLIKQGDGPWPPLSEVIRSESTPPVMRLRALMIYARSLLPGLEGHLLVWGLFPSTIGDVSAYGHFLEELVRHELPAPWCRNMRILVRDDPANPALKTMLSRSPRVAWYEPDLSQAAMAASLEDETNDESLPLTSRMQSLTVLAGLDFAHRRYTDALAKYRLAYRFYSGTGDNVMAALALNGIGEVHQRTGEPAQARRYFESALTPAIEAKSNAMLLNITLNLANQHLASEEWSKAAEYYDGAEKLATAQLIPQVKIQALENRGCCLAHLGNPTGAETCWVEAATLARGIEEKELLRSVLQRLKGHYKSASGSERLREVETELSSLGASPIGDGAAHQHGPGCGHAPAVRKGGR